MTWPGVLVDEDFPYQVIRALQAQGPIDVVFTAEEYGQGADDRVQVERAATRPGGTWVVVSHNKRQRKQWGLYVRAWRERGNETLSVLLLTRDEDDARLALRLRMLLDLYVALPAPKPRTMIWNDAAQRLIRSENWGGYSPEEIAYVLGRT